MIYRKDPNDMFTYKRWREGYTEFDIWFRSEDVVYADPDKDSTPEEIKVILRRWREKAEEMNKDERELYPVKHAQLDFIYNETVFRILPCTIGANRDSILEELAYDIRKELRESLSIERSRYFGMLD